MSYRMQRTARVVTAVIANGTSLSGEVSLEGAEVIALITPAAWTAAALTFQGAAAPGGTFADAYSDSTEISVASAAIPTSGPRAVSSPELAKLVGFGAIKVRSGTSGTPVNQGAARTITLILKG